MAQLLQRTQVPDSRLVGGPALLGIDTVRPGARAGLYVGWTLPVHPPILRPPVRFDMKFSPNGINFSGNLDTSLISLAPIGSPALAQLFDEHAQLQRVVVGWTEGFVAGGVSAGRFSTNQPNLPMEIFPVDWDGGGGFDGTGTTETSQSGPGLASHKGRLHLAWSDAASQQLRIAFAENADITTGFIGTFASPETAIAAPALCSFAGRLFIAWIGTDGRLNVGRVDLSAGRATAIHKWTYDETSRSGPALASHGSGLYIAWIGTDNRLNVMNIGMSAGLGTFFFPDTFMGRLFHLGRKFTAAEAAIGSPGIASFDGRFFIAWHNMLPELDDHVRVAEIDMTGLAPEIYTGRNHPRPAFP